MLINAKKIKGFNLLNHQEEFGNAKEFYFDDKFWTIRYLVVDTGGWLPDKQVLISPYLLKEVQEEDHDIAVNLTKKQMEESPSIDTDKPVSRQFEESYFQYFGIPEYWGGTSMWGAYPYIVRDPAKWQQFVESEKQTWDPHLRSTNEVTGYHIEATDGGIGHVDDFIVDTDTWAIRYLVVSTQNWWPGKKVLISPHWIERVSWGDQKVYVNLTRAAVKLSTEYEEGLTLTREYEDRLHRHYGQRGYWTNEKGTKTLSPK
ncbi:MAG: PRC-barrel domain-containing protein [Pseudobdellovibrio sp.]